MINMSQCYNNYGSNANESEYLMFTDGHMSGTQAMQSNNTLKITREGGLNREDSQCERDFSRDRNTQEYNDRRSVHNLSHSMIQASSGNLINNVSIGQIQMDNNNKTATQVSPVRL
jgi:hypothetical protein